MGGTKPLRKRYKGDPRGAGSKRGKATVGDLLWGLEFGGSQGVRVGSRYYKGTTLQFMPHKRKEGYVLWPTVRAHSGQTDKMYSGALLHAMEKMA